MSFRRDALQAVKRNPGYFAWWYTVKSVGLCLAVGVIGFFVGRSLQKANKSNEGKTP